jgi:hypothetical protein
MMRVMRKRLNKLLKRGNKGFRKLLKKVGIR